MRKASILAVLTIFLLACATLFPPPAPTSTPVPSPSSTSTSTETLIPSPYASPEPIQTDTPAVTAGPSETLAPTPWLFGHTALPATPRLLDCRLNWKSPGDGIIYDPGDTFTVGWDVTNTGSQAWDSNTVEFTWVGGAKMYDFPVVRLKASVAPGEEVVLSVHMRAPQNSTLYTTHWSLRQGTTYFCGLTESIYVD